MGHAVLFGHRHESATAEFHEDLIRFLHGEHHRGLVLGFRGCAKSTTAEEWLILRALSGRARNVVVFGKIRELAEERLDSIAHELETNDAIAELFGDPVGEAQWSSRKLVLANGCCIQARGRGQSMRGTKHRQWRPDTELYDDLEERDDPKQDDDYQRATVAWILSTAIPAMDQTRAVVRMLASPFHPKAPPLRLKNDAGWPTRVYPIETLDGDGERRPLWPARFPVSVIDGIKAEFRRLGMLTEYGQEYMCEAEEETEKTFQDRHISVSQVLRVHQPVWAMIDPARTKEGRAGTGIAVWSWEKYRMTVWEASQMYLAPDEIVAQVFRLDDEYRPIEIGIEEDGLEEFLRQPLRQEMLRRGRRFVPLRALRAPRSMSKARFISGLQPFYQAGDIVWAKEFADLREQQAAFRMGMNWRVRMDALNALAYAPDQRPGALMYEDFDAATHVSEELDPVFGAGSWLALNATGASTSAVLVQHGHSGIRVLWDAYEEAGPMDCLRDLVGRARLEAGEDPRLICSPTHFDQFMNHGLVQAAGRLPRNMSRGAESREGRAELSDWMRRTRAGLPQFRVSSRARWVMRGLQGGYSRKVGRDGVLAAEASEGCYKAVLEALEAFAGILTVNEVTDPERHDLNWTTSPSGRRYVSAMPRR